MSTRNKIRQSNLNRMDFFERKFIIPVYRAIRSQIRTFISDMKANGIDAAKRNMDYVVLNERVYNTVKGIYKTAGIFYANDTYRRIEEQVPKKQFGFNAEWAQDIINFFSTDLLNKATFPITETTKRYILQVLSEGENNGWGIDVIARKLLETGISPAEQLTMARARLITRTETAKAAFKGRELAKQKSPYKLTTEWIAAPDHRTRHSHKLMDGVVITEGQKFSVPRYKKIGKVDIQIGVDLMIGPGDPAGSKENVIKCRCTTAERVVFDAEDNPVMKRQNVLV